MGYRHRNTAIKPLFNKGPSKALRAFVLALIAVALIIASRFFSPSMQPVKDRLDGFALGFYWITDLPNRFNNWLDDSLVSREELLEENRSLKGERLILQRKLQQYATLAADNARLRQLMNSAELVQDRVLIAELIGVSPDPTEQVVVVNKGSEHGVFIGQPLLDAFGLMGQVIEVNPYFSRVLLITDASHALSVQINRNGVRAVAEGTGDLYELKLRHVSNTIDVKVGDLLVSSGLGQRFPVGYPVAEVVSILHDPGRAFATVIARPKAQLNRSRHVLLAFSGQRNEGRP
ncbi:rod shape-determining protein MreC [Pseudoteredinibacter isoporae]|uniref:rod shape-determining protein MreC n=1 Tax=Pseudoteredinibacter isoporae TaxID=570281 RepID=UPI001AA0263B|nr:rod shape-determining protein MreC [Pseudoteredinibacter isoporae]